MAKTQKTKKSKTSGTIIEQGFSPASCGTTLKGSRFVRARLRCPTGSCNIESLITLDERGQMVLPKEVRDKAKIRPGEKLAVVTWIKNGKTCCISLIKAEEFSEMLKGILEPMVKGLINK